jgi:flagellar basal body-associated protein FliL
MADEEAKKEEVKDKEAKPGKGKGLVGWIITFVVVVACSVGGYGLSGLFAKTAPEETETVAKGEELETDPFPVIDPSIAKPWTFEMEPIVANLNEPGSTRMIQLGIVLDMSRDMDEVLGTEFLEEKKLYLRDSLMTYLSGLNLEQVSGSSSKNRMKVEIKEDFNEILFPDSKPLLNRVMFKGCTIQ